MAPKKSAKRKADGDSAPAAAPAPAVEDAPKKQKVVKDETASGGAVGKKVVIEAWANKLEGLLKEAGFHVSINPEKPRKGSFEVRAADGGKTFVSLLDMPRPFTKLKALDVEELAAEIIKG